jgi:hypothetical protein
MLVAKLRKAREVKNATIRCCEGRKPYGFFEGEAKVIKRIKQLHRKLRGGKRLGPYQILSYRQLNPKDFFSIFY